jgi:Carbohydrate-binding family 9
MKKIIASYLMEQPLTNDCVNLFLYLDNLERHSMNFTPWSSHTYKPNVHFSIAYNSHNIFLKYYVTEKFIKAANGFINAPVYDDTCVEFFISFNKEPAYYNFEFNCIGNSLVGFGKGKEGRQLLPEDVINNINYHVSISNTKDNLKYWELSIAIPYSVFCYHDIASLKGKECNVNFYKCGDMLKVPHFLTWSNIESIEPDFHLPQFFGTLAFE